LTQSDYVNKFENDYKLIHYICKHSQPDVVENIINFYIDHGKTNELHHKTRGGWEPIYYIFKHSTSKISHTIIDYYEKNNISLDKTKNIEWSPLHICARCQTPDVIIRMIDIYDKNNFDMNIYDFYGFTPLHYICRYSTRKVINYIINKNVKLMLLANREAPHKSFIDLMNENSNLNKIEISIV
jgi:ankyrin repeat protein